MSTTRASRLLLYLLLLVVGTGVGIGSCVFYLLRSSVQRMDGTVVVHGLGARAEMAFDGLGIPRIEAKTREDAFFALGFCTTRDRLFQMDLLRRRSAGRLAEIFGPDAVESDKRNRTMGFEQIASGIIATLPANQTEALRFYTKGVNHAIRQFTTLPVEFVILGYQPRPWRPEDSILVVLGLYVDLGGNWESERSTTIMQATLPKPVFDFFTPRTDPYTDRTLGGSGSATTHPFPVSELIALLEKGGAAGRSGSTQEASHGSNAWVVGPSRSRDGRAILANDMHLDLGVPNIWYRAELSYEDVHLAGFTLPGVPLMISGSNGHIAWGFTGSGTDVLDLVAVEVDRQDASQYKTAEGWRPFDVRDEFIHVKGVADETLTVRSTVWGPVLPMPFFEKPFAVRWIALDVQATNLKLMDLDRVRTAQDALALFNHAGGPVLNALVTDAQGNIGWTLTGRIPLRSGLDGLVTEPWADGTRGWRGYIQPHEIPRQLNPPEGFIVSANQKMIGRNYPLVPASYAAPGYRAFRITERLRDMQDISEKDMLALQLDTQADAYRYYQALAIKALNSGDETPETAALKRYLERWDGYAEPDSSGLALLVEFRRALLEEVLSPFLGRCHRLDPRFDYRWNYPDVPLQRLLDARLPELLPDRQRYTDWDSFIRVILVRESRRLVSLYKVHRLNALTWGRTDLERIAHPLSKAIPLFGYLLDMPEHPLPGCPYCVRAARGGGATERLVVSPGREKDGLFHMPGGQSGHPLSPYYSDQHMAWVQGVGLPFLAGKAVHKIVLLP